jgi:hypothetical protein
MKRVVPSVIETAPPSKDVDQLVCVNFADWWVINDIELLLGIGHESTF